MKVIKIVLLMLLLDAGVFGGCSRENTRVDVIDAKAQELVGMVEQNYREWNSMSFMARFEGELLALPKKIRSRSMRPSISGDDWVEN